MNSAVACRGLSVRAARVWRCRAGVWMLAVMLVLPALVQARADTPAGTEGWQLLRRVQEAARQVDYAGVFTWQQGSSLQSSRIVHVVDGTGERERIEILDGAAREFIRHNDVVQCLIPEKKLVLVEEQRIHRFPSLMLEQEAAVHEHYDLTVGQGGQRVAGRSCRLIDIRPRDTLRYGHRLCVDDQTDLLIKAQTLNEFGQVIDQVAFTSLQFGDAVPVEQLVPGWDTQGWKVIQTAGTEVHAEDQGWRIPPPAGFRYVAQMARPARGGKTLTHLVMTDGLAAISVFIEPISEKSGALSAQSRSAGAMSMHGLRVADYWLTLVGEVPLNTLHTLAEQVEYVPPAGTSR